MDITTCAAGLAGVAGVAGAPGAYKSQICRTICMANSRRCFDDNTSENWTFGVRLPLPTSDANTTKWAIENGFDLEEHDLQALKIEYAFDMTRTVQLQATNCSRCGNYKCISSSIAIHKNSKCECPWEFDDGSAHRTRQLELYKSMDKFDSFDPFIKLMLPEGKNDRLCEDVIGEIFRYL